MTAQPPISLLAAGFSDDILDYLIPDATVSHIREIQEKLYYCKSSLESNEEGFAYLTSPFQRSTWIVILFIYLLVVLVLVFQNVSLHDASFFAAVLFLKQDLSSIKGWILFPLGFISLMMVILVALYESYITGKVLLADKPFVYPDMRSLLGGGYKIYEITPYLYKEHAIAGMKTRFIAGDAIDIFESAKKIEDIILLENGTPQSFIQRVGRNEKLAASFSTKTLSRLTHFVEHHYPYLNCFMVPQILFNRTEGWSFICRFRAQFSAAMNLYSATGLVDIWYRYLDGVNKYKIVSAYNMVKPLGFSSRVLAIFLILGFGLAASLIVVCLEKIMQYFRKCKQHPPI